jgi:predicted HAD superfamily Cof-like phosphohydrolase
MNKRTAQLREFHKLIGAPVLETPQTPEQDRVRLRMRMLLEETIECLDACFIAEQVTIYQVKKLIEEFISKNEVSVSLENLADGLGDVDYIVEGTRLEFGIDGEPIADAIHASNMAKVGPDGWIVRRADGKVLKPEGWKPPDITGELQKQGWKE